MDVFEAGDLVYVTSLRQDPDPDPEDAGMALITRVRTDRSYDISFVDHPRTTVAWTLSPQMTMVIKRFHLLYPREAGILMGRKRPWQGCNDG